MNAICRGNTQDLTRGELSETLFLYEYIACMRTYDGWIPHLVTFLFKDMSNPSEANRVRIMAGQIEAFYKKLITHVVRRPRTQPCPILIAAPDMPVPKTEKKEPDYPFANDGLHFHAILLLPPKNRLKEPLSAHIQTKWRAYQGPDTLFFSIDVEPIQETPGKAVQYVLKSISRRRFTYDDGILLLPRAISEL